MTGDFQTPAGGRGRGLSAGPARPGGLNAGLSAGLDRESFKEWDQVGVLSCVMLDLVEFIMFVLLESIGGLDF